MAWLFLAIAGVLEVVWAFSMKQSSGFTRLWPTVITVATMIASFALLSIAMKTLPLGTAYTVWTGIGAVGAFVVGVLVLGEEVSVARILAAILIVSGRASSMPQRRAAAARPDRRWRWSVAHPPDCRRAHKSPGSPRR
jgi:quaternary ammonium compound-resistance protein SugE